MHRRGLDRLSPPFRTILRMRDRAAQDLTHTGDARRFPSWYSSRFYLLAIRIRAMINDSSETIRHLIRLANDGNLDPQSRNTICEVARQMKSLHNVSQKINDLDTKLKAFRRADRLHD